MIFIGKIAGVFHSGKREERNLVLFHFYCDESYDGKANDPDCFTISGFFSDQPTWEEVEEEWNGVNSAYGVQAFHATHLNGRRNEYAGWDDSRKRSYSAALLQCVGRQGARMRAYNCGVRGDAYRKVISNAGQIKLGHPWILCFNSCVAMIAKDMQTLPEEDSFSIVFGRETRFDSFAVASFAQMSENPLFPYAHRLMTCTPGDPNKIVLLQVADLMAYEYFRRMKSGSGETAMRCPLQFIRENNGYCEGFFDENVFVKMKQDMESAICGPSQLVVIPQL